MRIIFFGSDDFAATHLEALLSCPHQVVACVTQPDRARGRGLRVDGNPVKEMAVSAKLPVFQPDDLRDQDFLRTMREMRPDLFVVIAYGKILPADVLKVPSVCAMNVHGSLLPKYRGAAPINWAVMNGETETGLSIIKMNPSMDAGDIFSQERIAIRDEDTAWTLRQRMAQAGRGLLLRTIEAVAKNSYTLTVQDKAAVTLAPKLTKELGLIDWGKPAVHIHNRVRGLLPWPAAYTSAQGKTIKILETLAASAPHSGQPGEILSLDKDGFLVAAGEGAVLVRQVHPESSKSMDARSFWAGYKLKPGDRLGTPPTP